MPPSPPSNVLGSIHQDPGNQTIQTADLKIGFQNVRDTFRTLAEIGYPNSAFGDERSPDGLQRLTQHLYENIKRDDRSFAAIFDITKKSKTECRLHVALEHACIEVLRSVIDSDQSSVQDNIDRHEQRIHRIQKQLSGS